jgi:hypothetical protein
MPDNNMMIMMGLGMAALWFLNRGGSEEDQVDQLAGASMMASGEGTAPDAPFQTYSAPANPVFFFNQGGQMTKVPGTNVPLGASSDEDIGIYPGMSRGYGDDQVQHTTVPELEFTVAKSIPPAGTSDDSPTTPEFAGTAATTVTASTVWDQQALIANANFMPLLAIQDTGGGGVDILGSNVDISNLSSKERFRAVNLDTGFAFTTSAAVLSEYVQGFTGSDPIPAYVPQTWQQIESDWRQENEPTNEPYFESWAGTSVAALGI